MSKASEITRLNLRELVIALLDDSHGISEKSYELLKPFLINSDNEDIVKEATVYGGRAFFENEEYGLEEDAKITVARAALEEEVEEKVDETDEEKHEAS